MRLKSNAVNSGSGAQVRGSTRNAKVKYRELLGKRVSLFYADFRGSFKGNVVRVIFDSDGTVDDVKNIDAAKWQFKVLTENDDD